MTKLHKILFPDNEYHKTLSEYTIVNGGTVLAINIDLVYQLKQLPTTQFFLKNVEGRTVYSLANILIDHYKEENTEVGHVILCSYCDDKMDKSILLNTPIWSSYDKRKDFLHNLIRPVDLFKYYSTNERRDILQEYYTILLMEFSRST